MNRIVFCTLAYDDRCRELSKKLIDSLVKHAPDYKLVIATDDVDYYKDYANVFAHEVDLRMEEINCRCFPFNAKLLPIEYSFKLFSPECIIYLDADCILSREDDFQIFLNAHEGVSLVRGTPAIPEEAPDLMKQKLTALNFNPSELLYIFREQVMVVKIESSDKFLGFIEEWKNIFDIIMERDICQHMECVEVGLACQRSGFSINDIRENESIQGKIEYTSLFLSECPYPDQPEYVNALA